MSHLLAMDCEMVGSGNESILARVTIVDETGMVVLDEYVKPIAPVTDYRTCYSGVKNKKVHIENGSDFIVVRNKVANIINGCILVGHCLHFDLKTLYLSHPEDKVRDLSTYQTFDTNSRGQPLSLNTLAKEYLGRNIQNGGHDSVEDAKACMALYRKFPNNSHLPWNKGSTALFVILQENHFKLFFAFLVVLFVIVLLQRIWFFA